MIVGDMEIRLRADIARLQRDMDGARQVVDSAASGISRAADMAKMALASIGLGAGMAQIIAMSDQYTKFTAQLKLASTSTREYGLAMADVKRIANSAQQDLGSTGVLYARIANGTRELGVAQSQVAKITEVVNLSLKVSGATTAESASAQLQLSQAFASGTLRGEEFNAVNEAAPRLMKALADGMGVPVGALKQMATEGKITSAIMADVLPKALEAVREEAKKIQTIGGAFQELKNNLMEFVGIQSQASGGVSMLIGIIKLLSDNLLLVVGAIATLSAAKLSSMFAAWITDAITTAAANRALAATTLQLAVTTTEAAAVASAAKLAEMRANTVAAASASSLVAARVAELRTAVLAAEGAVALAIATNGLIPAQARAIALSEALAVARAAEAIAANKATVAAIASTVAIDALAVSTTFAARAMGVLKATMAFFGGSIGFIVTLLGAAATAWMIYSNKTKEASDKAAVAVDESTTEMIDRLDKQIAKLTERNALLNVKPELKGANQADIDGLARASSALSAARNGTGQYAGASSSMRQLAEIDLAHDYTEALGKVNTAQRLVTEAANGTRNAQIKKWFDENGTQAQQMTAALEKLKTQFGTIPPVIEKLVRAKYADKGAAKAGHAAEKADLAASLDSIKYGIEVEKALRGEGLASVAELTRQGMASDAQYNAAKVVAALAAGTDVARVKQAEIDELAKFRGKDLAERTTNNGKIARLELERVEALRASKVAAAMIETQYAFDKEKPMRDDQAKTNTDLSAIYAQTAAVELQIRTYNMLPAAITAVAIAELEAQKAAISSFEGNVQAVDGINQKIAALRGLAAVQVQSDAQNKGSDLTRATELLAVMSELDSVAQKAAQGMTASFGKVGSAIGGMTTALTGFSRTQAAIAAQLAGSMKDAGGDKTKIYKAQTLAAEQSAAAQIHSYGDMAGAAKTFFKENSTGYKVMEGVEKTYRAFEMAMAVQSMLTKSGLLAAFTGLFVTAKLTETTAEVASLAPTVAVEGAKQGVYGITALAAALALPFPANIPAFAIVAAMLAAIGVVVAGGGGGGSADVSKDRQAAAGTGTVLGDPLAKSESIAKSLEILDKNSGLGLVHSQSMVLSLKAVVSGIGNLSSSVARTTGVLGVTTNGIDTEKAGFWASLFGASTISIMDKGITFGVSKIATELLDSYKALGLPTLAGGKTLGEIKDSGIQGKTYTDIKESGWWHGDEDSRQADSLSKKQNEQFALTINSMAKSVSEAAATLGVGGDAFAAHMDSFKVQIEDISSKGLTGTEFEKQVQAIFSSLGDEMAAWGVTGIDEFAKAGEGAFETLARVTNDFIQVGDVLAMLGQSFGVMGMDAVTLSENLILAAGGLDNLTSGTQYLVDNIFTDAEKIAPIATSVKAAMGLLSQSSVTTISQFDALVRTQKLGTTEGDRMYASLMNIAPAFKQAADYSDGLNNALGGLVETIKSAADIASEAKDLQDQIDTLTMSTAQLATKARNAIDPLNRALYDLVQAGTKVAEFTKRKDELDIELMTELNDASGALAATRAAELKALTELSPALATLQQHIYAVKDAASAAAISKTLTGILAPDADVLTSAHKLIDTTFTKLGISLTTTNAQLLNLIANATTAASIAGRLVADRPSFEAAITNTTPQSAEVDALFKKLGGDVPKTLADYDRILTLVQEGSGGSLSLLNALNDLAPALKTVQDAADAADKATAAAAKTAADDLAAKNKALQDQIVTLTKAALPLAEQRALEVIGLDATTLALQKQVYALTDAAAQRTMELTLYGLTHTAAETLANTRRLELTAMDASLRPLQNQIYAQQDLASQRALELTLYDLTHTAAEQLANSRRLELAAMNASLRPLQQQIYAQQDLKTATDTALDAVKKAIDAEKTRIGIVRDAASESVTSITSVFDALKSAVTELYGTVDSTAAMKAGQGNTFIDNALSNALTSGYLPDSKELGDAIAAARGGLDANQFATQFEADKAALVMAGKLSQLKDLAGPQLTAAEKALEVAKNQLIALDDQLTLAQKQVDAINGVNTSVLSVSAALAALASALAAQAAAKVVTPVTGGGGYTANYQGADGTYSPGVTDIAHMPGTTVWITADDAINGSHANGLDSVPFDGYRAELHRGEMVLPAHVAQSVRGGGNAANTERMESLIEGLTVEVKRLQGIVNDGNKHAQRTANAVNGNPDAPMLVETV